MFNRVENNVDLDATYRRSHMDKLCKEASSRISPAQLATGCSDRYLQFTSFMSFWSRYC